MRLYKKILFRLFLLLQTTWAVTNILFVENTALQIEIHRYERYFLVALALAFIFFEIKYWKAKDADADQLSKQEKLYREVSQGNRIAVITGLSVSLAGLLCLLLDLDTLGMVVMNVGYLIILGTLYIMTKPAGDGTKP